MYSYSSCLYPLSSTQRSSNKTLCVQYANIMGLSEQLHLTGSQYSHASAAFYIAVLIFSLANVWLLNRLPVAKCLGVDLLGWGLATACHAALRGYAGLAALRVVSGAFESGVPPALMLLCSQYFTYGEQALRFSYWYAGMGFGQMAGGILSFAFQHVPPSASLSGWRTMFVIIGLVTAALGTLILLFVPDTPMQARFLTTGEKVALLDHVAVNQTGIGDRQFKPRQLLEGLRDPGCWAFFLIVVLHASGSGVVTAYSAVLLTSFGYAPQHAALLNIPSGAVNILATLAYGYAVRRGCARWLVCSLAGAAGTLGACLLAFAPHTHKAALLAGIYLINLMPGATVVVFQWRACNTAGHTKRAYATAGMGAAFAVGNIIGPETFQARHAPEYRPAKLTLVAMWATSILVVVLCRFYFVAENKTRDNETDGGGGGSEGEVVLEVAYAGLTDKENRRFRYHL